MSAVQGKSRWGVWVLLALAGLSLWLSSWQQPATAAFATGVPDGKWIHISVPRKCLTLYEGTRELAKYTVATGTWQTPTPLGVYRITSRFAGEMSGFGTRFLGINVPWGQFGIHGTNKPTSIGGDTSHGCVRMFVKDAEKLYAAVPNGTMVVIEGGPYGLMDGGYRVLHPGDRGNQVTAVLDKLRALGFYAGGSDGIYGAGMSRAVKAAQQYFGLPVQDMVDAALYRALGVIQFE